MRRCEQPLVPVPVGCYAHIVSPLATLPFGSREGTGRLGREQSPIARPWPAMRAQLGEAIGIVVTEAVGALVGQTQCPHDQEI